MSVEGTGAAVPERRTEMIGLETGIAAADGDVDSVAAVERRYPDRHRAVRRYHDRAKELHVLQYDRAGGTCQHRRRLSHGLHAEHRGKQQVAVEQVIDEVRVAVRGQVSVRDQLDAGVVDARPVDEPGER